MNGPLKTKGEHAMSRYLWMIGLLLLAPVAWAEEPVAKDLDPAAMMKMMEEFARPSPEVEKLAPLVGKWEYTGKFYMDPKQSPMETSGTVERKWILGNRFVHETYTGTGFDGKPGFEGRGVIGYDKGRKMFTSAWICNMCTAISNSQGSADADGKTFTFTREDFCPLRQKMVKGKEVMRIESNDKVVLESYEIDNGQERKTMEIVTVRKD
jgi:hypothetical protein